ncbi:hypothetical protein JXQ31_20925 [candidate division KSB1 bacterium]|nr:hypothetical protein [candidate division KSB1 bacterium]
MSDILYWAMIIILGGFFAGLLIYGFYIVLTSKSVSGENKKSTRNIYKPKMS